MKESIKIGLLVLLCFSLSLLGQQDQSKTDQHASFEVRLNKKAFVVYEPVLVEFRVKLSDAAKRADLTREVFVKVIRDNTVVYDGALYPSLEPAARLPLKTANKLIPPALAVQTVVLTPIRDSLALPGEYKLEFSLFRNERRITSDPLTFRINEPSGLNREAILYLKGLPDTIMSFEWAYRSRDDLAKLENFIAKFRKSAYGDTALENLGNAFLFRGEFEKAKRYFVELMKSKESYFTNKAKEGLREVESQTRSQMYRKLEVPNE